MAAIRLATAIMIANLIAAIAVVQRRDVPFAMVFIWADLAIAQRHQGIPTIWITTLVMVVALVGLLVRSRYPRKSW